jgi:hypothetical protein
MGGVATTTGAGMDPTLAIMVDLTALVIAAITVITAITAITADPLALPI